MKAPLLPRSQSDPLECGSSTTAFRSRSPFLTGTLSFTLTALTLLHLLSPARADDVCRLTISLIDAESGQPLPGLVRMRPDGATTYTGIPELLNRLTGLPTREQMRGWHSLTGRSTVTVPQAPLTFEAFYGIETELAEAKLSLSGKSTATLEIPLRRFFNPRDHGWMAGNTHLHLRDMPRDQADRYLLTIPAADGLDLVFLSHLERALVDRTYISNHYTSGDLAALSKEGVLFGNGEEHRHNFSAGGEGFGHVMLLNIAKLIQPVSIGPGITEKGTDALPLQRGIRTARNDGATIIWCHNKLGFEDIPNWAGGLIDAQNIFDGGTQGTYEDTYYRYLNIGLRVPFSTGTDWFIYDLSRVYVPVTAPRNVENWLDALADGTSLITNGPILELEAAGDTPGGVINLDSAGTVSLRGHAIGRADFEKLELLWNGNVIHTAPSRNSGGHYEAALTHDVAVTEPGWLALRITTEHKNELGRSLFAHTSPIYVKMAGRFVFSPTVARELIAEMEASIAAIESQATFAGDTERDGVLEVYREGIRTLQERMVEASRK